MFTALVVVENSELCDMKYSLQISGDHFVL